MKTRFLSFFAALYLSSSLSISFSEDKCHIPEVKWDAQSLIIDGERVTPVMGEIHYSRLRKANGVHQ